MLVQYTVNVVWPELWGSKYLSTNSLTTFHFGNYQLSKEGHWATDWYKKQVFIGIIHTLNFFFFFLFLMLPYFEKGENTKETRNKIKRQKENTLSMNILKNKTNIKAEIWPFSTW